jgi:hypothetical protein
MFRFRKDDTEIHTYSSTLVVSILIILFAKMLKFSEKIICLNEQHFVKEHKESFGRFNNILFLIWNCKYLSIIQPNIC